MTSTRLTASLPTNLHDMPRFVDTHAHLDLPAFDHDREVVITAARASGVQDIVNVGFRPSRWQTTIALSAAHAGVHHMLGLHPQHADELSDDLLDEVAVQLRSSSAVALGEIGFDFFRDGSEPAIQERAFVAQIELARALGLPIVIHQRAAEARLMAVLACFPDLSNVVLHSFDGSRRLADFGRERGYYFGVGGLMTRSGNQTLREVIGTLPLDHLLLETDAPYLAPAGVKDRRNVPANVPLVASRLADLFGLPLVEVAHRTTDNAMTFFALTTGVEM